MVICAPLENKIKQIRAIFLYICKYIYIYIYTYFFKKNKTIKTREGKASYTSSLRRRKGWGGWGARKINYRVESIPNKILKQVIFG